MNLFAQLPQLCVLAQKGYDTPASAEEYISILQLQEVEGAVCIYKIGMDQQFKKNKTMILKNICTVVYSNT